MKYNMEAVKTKIEKMMLNWNELEFALKDLGTENVAESFLVYETVLGMDISRFNHGPVEFSPESITRNMMKEMDMETIKKEAEKLIELSETVDVEQFENPKEMINFLRTL